MVVRDRQGRAGDPSREAKSRRLPARSAALTDHATVLARAKAAVAKIEAGMAWAQRTGVLHELNQESRCRRLEAQRRGERFMGYTQATARLRRAITKVAATGRAPVAIVQEVSQVRLPPDSRCWYPDRSGYQEATTPASLRFHDSVP
jgi:hypothetical protein